MQWERERHHEMEETETESVRSALLEASPTTAAAAALATTATATLPATVVVVGKYFKVAVNSQQTRHQLNAICVYACTCVSVCVSERACAYASWVYE